MKYDKFYFPDKTLNIFNNLNTNKMKLLRQNI